jgi:hypothetical protein
LPKSGYAKVRAKNFGIHLFDSNASTLFTPLKVPYSILATNIDIKSFGVYHDFGWAQIGAQPICLVGCGRRAGCWPREAGKARQDFF